MNNGEPSITFSGERVSKLRYIIVNAHRSIHLGEHRGENCYRASKTLADLSKLIDELNVILGIENNHEKHEPEGTRYDPDE